MYQFDPIQDRLYLPSVAQLGSNYISFMLQFQQEVDSLPISPMFLLH
jgi:hypothetical protein